MTNVGQYTPPKNPSTRFVVQNILPFRKTIHIFQFPIPQGQFRDLLAIPGISEADIRHSLLKGEILQKLLCKEIRVIDSDIDLLQFNDDQKAFLQASGITKGLEVEAGQISSEVIEQIQQASIPYLFRQNVPLLGTKDGVNRIFTLPETFVNGTLANNEFRVLIRHNGKGLEENVDYTLLESGGAGTGFDTIIFISFIPVASSRLLADYVTRV